MEEGRKKEADGVTGRERLRGCVVCDGTSRAEG